MIIVKILIHIDWELSETLPLLPAPSQMEIISFLPTKVFARNLCAGSAEEICGVPDDRAEQTNTFPPQIIAFHHSVHVPDNSFTISLCRMGLLHLSPLNFSTLWIMKHLRSLTGNDWLQTKWFSLGCSQCCSQQLLVAVVITSGHALITAGTPGGSGESSTSQYPRLKALLNQTHDNVGTHSVLQTHRPQCSSMPWRCIKIQNVTFVGFWLF